MMKMAAENGKVNYYKRVVDKLCKKMGTPDGDLPLNSSSDDPTAIFEQLLNKLIHAADELCFRHNGMLKNYHTMVNKKNKICEDNSFLTNYLVALKEDLKSANEKITVMEEELSNVYKGEATSELREKNMLMLNNVQCNDEDETVIMKEEFQHDNKEEEKSQKSYENQSENVLALPWIESVGHQSDVQVKPSKDIVKIHDSTANDCGFKCYRNIFECWEYSCNYCKKFYPTKKEINRHLNIHIKKFQCKFCGKSYDRYTNLHQHLERHLRKKNFCDNCEATFQFKYQLARHKDECVKNNKV